MGVRDGMVLWSLNVYCLLVSECILFVGFDGMCVVHDIL